MRTLIIILTLAIAIGSTNAEERPTQDGNWLMPGLLAIINVSEDHNYQIDDDTRGRLYYTSGMLHGVVTSSGFWTQVHGNKIGIVVPDNTSTTQLARIVYKYLSENPKVLNQPAAMCVLYGLISQYAIKEEKK